MEMFKLALKIQSHFTNFYLGGGTAIMFKYNHRKSYDLDFFNISPFSFSRIAIKVRNYFRVEKEEKFIDNIDFYINGIKVSFLLFPFQNIDRIEKFKGLKIASDYDLFLNKIYVAGRRIEDKDLIDCAFLYKKYKWNKEIIETDFEKKFPNQSYKIYIGALLSFGDYHSIPKWAKETLKKLRLKL